MWQASVFTLMPEMFPGPLGAALAGEALAKGLWRLDVHAIRPFGLGRHFKVDDTPAGGGAGMVLRADVVAACLDTHVAAGDSRPRLFMSPRGKPFDQQDAKTLSTADGVILLCARYEGLDERLLAARNFTEVSLGDFVLSGGEIAAMAMVDACVRLIPGVMGNATSGSDESFATGLLEYPHYTRPRAFAGLTIPDVLLEGDHAKIASWRRAQARKITKERRPDVWARYLAHKGENPDESEFTLPPGA